MYKVTVLVTIEVMNFKPQRIICPVLLCRWTLLNLPVYMFNLLVVVHFIQLDECGETTTICNGQSLIYVSVIFVKIVLVFTHVDAETFLLK